MRVLHLGKFFPPIAGGIEYFMADLAAGLHAKGVRNEVLVHRKAPFRPGRRENLPYATVYRVPTMGQVVYAPIAPTFPLQLALRVRSFKPDVIHAHVPNTSAFFALAAPKSIPMVLHWHADVVSSAIDTRLKLLYPPYSIFEKALLNRASKIICTSREYMESSIALTDFQHKCEVIPLGIGQRNKCAKVTETALTREILDKAGNRPIILSVGRFTYYKGFDVLVKAAEQLPDCFFIICGDGPLRPSIEKQVSQAGLGDRVHIAGWVSDQDLNALYRTCTIYCMSSVERTEAFGLVLLEAMACAKPLITTQIEGSGARSVNIDGETGVCVPVGDANALAKAITELASSPEQCHNYGQTALKRFETNFSMEHVAQQTLEVYRSVTA